MELFSSDFRMIARGMSSYDISLYMADEKAAARCTDCAVFSATEGDYPPETVFIIPPKARLPIGFFQQTTGNYLVLSRFTPIDDTAPIKANIIAVDSTEDEFDVFESLVATCNALRRFRESQNKLLAAALAHASFKEYVALFAELLGNPVALFDVRKTSFVAASDYAHVRSEHWRSQVSSPKLDATSQEITSVVFGEVPAFFESLRRPTIEDAYDDDRRLLAGVFIGNSCRYVLTVLEEATLSKSDIVLSDYLALLLSFVVPEIENTQRDSTAKILEDALAGGDAPRDLDARATALGIVLDDANVMYLVFDKERKATYKSLRNLAAELVPKIPLSLIEVHGLEVVIVTTRPSCKVEEAIATCKSIDGILSWSVGASLPFSSFKELSAAYQQCRHVKRRVRETGAQGRSFRYEDFSFQHLVAKASGHVDVRSHLDPLLDAMLAYDRRTEGDLTLTLYTYLRNFKGKKETASKLYIHQNTVAYRLDRIKSLFGVDLDDNDTLFNFLMSCEMYLALQDGPKEKALHAEGQKA